MGPAGTNGTDGTNGMNGMNGADGSDGQNGNDIILSDTAKHGLDIAPVALDLTGKTGDEIEAIGQGSYLLNAAADCAGCHGQPGSTPGYLAGVATQGSFNARNLTPDPTTGLQLTEDQFITVMRTGTNFICSGGTCTADTHTLKVMPWADFRWASRPDLKAIYAYLRAIPPVQNQVPADTGTLGGAPGAGPTQYTDGYETRALPAELDGNGNAIPDPGSVRRGMAIQPLAQMTSLDAAREAQLGRGSYLVTSLGACNGCHTNPARTGGVITTSQYLAGGRVFSFPLTVAASTGVVRSMTADLTGQGGGYFGESDADFTTFTGILATGVHIDDPNLPPLAAPMPWQHLRNLTISDQAAIFTYLQSLQSTQPAPLAADKATQDASYYCAADADCNALNGGTAGVETCDLDSTSATYHECVGRTCHADSECRTCQQCDTATNKCGGALIAACSAGL